VTADALAFERELRRDGLQEGALVQRLARTTGDPAVSPDGRYVALTIRRTDAPSQLVVWRTIDEPDTTAARRREQELARDPEDVPDRIFYPPPKKPVVALVAPDGAPYETPRWFADNKHLLVTRRVPIADGALRPDLYVWNAEDGSLRRVTHGAALRDADVSPDGRWAAAVHCAHGWCDLVRVDLESGEFRTIHGGSSTRNYYRPRVSRTTGEIVVAEQSNDRWRVARVDPRTGALRYADPDDGVTRYDATWTPDGTSIVTTSEAGGVANLERIDSAGSRAVRLTSVTGAAVAADVASDGMIWFLSLHGTGYDLRRLRPDTLRQPRIPPVSALADSSSPVLPPRAVPQPTDSTRRPAAGMPAFEHPYGTGPTRVRYLPSSTSGPGGSSTQLALVRSDPVGRLGVSLIGSVGAAALPAGGAMEIALRMSRTLVTADGWISHEAPSRLLADAVGAGLDLTRAGGALRADRTHVGDGGEITATLAGLSERQHALGSEATDRNAGIFAFDGMARQRDDETRYVERLQAMGEVGRTLGGQYLRQRAALVFGVAAGANPLTTVTLAYGTVGGNAADRERFVIGGIGSPLVDSLYDARRVDAPAYPLASRLGNNFAVVRVGVPLAPFELFYSGASTDMFRTPARSYGAELRIAIPEIAALGTPNVDAMTGMARAVDEPVKGMWRYYVSVTVRP
jgi:Tol biopolymer transport system component